MAEAAMWPIQTAMRHNATDPAMFPPAASHSSSRIRFKVCKLKDENVVNPPQRPAMTNWRVVAETKRRPSVAVKVAKKPMTKEPRMLTRSVPHGKVSPKAEATAPDIA